jgi:hypothetical protein
MNLIVWLFLYVGIGLAMEHVFEIKEFYVYSFVYCVLGVLLEHCNK